MRPIVAGAGIGALVSLSPLTPSPFGLHAWTSLGAGLVSGVAAGWLLRAYQPGPRVVAPLLARAMTPGRFVALAALAIAFAPTFSWLFRHWTFSLWRDIHGLFVPIAMVLLARRTLARAAPFEAAGSAWGWVALAPSAALLALARAHDDPMLGAVALVLALPALAWAILGAPLARSLWPIFLLGVFMLPAPLESPLHGLLMQWTAAAVEPLLVLTGHPLVRTGTLLEMGSHAFSIAESCSGVSTLYAMGFVGMALASCCRSTRRAAAVAALALPIAFAANAIRVAALILASLSIGTDFLETPVHKGTGAVTFLVAFAMLGVVAGRGPLRAIAGLPEEAR